MVKNKIILKHCPNYYNIKNYEVDEDDYLSMKLISIYEEYIFSIDETNQESLKKIEELDTILKKYITDYNFRKELKIGLTKIRVKRDNNILESIVNGIISLFDNYEEYYTRNIYFARWV